MQVKEIIYPLGATIDVRAIRLGDETMSVLEIWGAEYQENDCLLIRAGDRGLLEGICGRERALMQVLPGRRPPSVLVYRVGHLHRQTCWRASAVASTPSCRFSLGAGRLLWCTFSACPAPTACSCDPQRLRLLFCSPRPAGLV